jgi:hypothetical protein
MVRDVTVEKSTHAGSALVLEDCDTALVDGVTVRETSTLAAAVRYRLTKPVAYSGLRIAHVVAPVASEAGIVLEASKDSGAMLTDYIVHGNLATVADRIRGARGTVEGNQR